MLGLLFSMTSSYICDNTDTNRPFHIYNNRNESETTKLVYTLQPMAHLSFTTTPNRTRRTVTETKTCTYSYPNFSNRQQIVKDCTYFWKMYESSH